MQTTRPQSSKPRRSSTFANYTKSVCSAFQYDTERFLEKFEKEKSLNYADFANIWQSMNFTFVFADQDYTKPLQMLCELCFFIVKKYIIFQSSVYIQIGAFYLLYGLYYKQPIQRMVKIRLTLEEFRKLKTLMDQMEIKGQYDALYIFAKMKTDGAFLFVAHQRPLNLLTKPNASLDTDNTFSKKNFESSLYKFENVLKDQTVVALEKTCIDYDARLKSFAKTNPTFVPLKSNFFNDLNAAHKQVYTTKESDEQEAQPQVVESNTRQSVRLKALANKNAQYRGSKKVITALDLKDQDSHSESD